MQTRVLVAMTLLGVAAGCSPRGERCGTEICTKEQRCSAEETCVTDGKPVISLTAPLEMAAITTEVVEVRGVAKDDDKPPTVEVTASNGATWIPAKLNADGSFVLQVPVPKIDSSTTVVRARVRDSKQQENQASRTLNVDNVPPACELVTPMAGGMTNRTGTLPVSVHASDGSLRLLNPRFSSDGAMTFVPITGGNGNYDFGWQLPIENGVAHTLVFRLEDGAGLSCEVRGEILVDNVKPTVSFNLPAAGSLLGVPFFTAGGRFGGLASDGTRALKSVMLDFADLAGPRPATLQANGWTVMVPAPAGDDYKLHNVTVVATDLSDNTASATLSVTVDVKAPALAITNPVGGAKLNVSNFLSGNNVALMWTLTDGDPQLNLGIITADGGFLSPPVLPTAATDNPKTYQPVLRANDRAGNVSTATVSFTVDRVVPTVSSYTPANNTRMYPGIATADFSEPMMGGAGLSLNPQLPGTWTTSRHFEITGLAKDSVYTATTGFAEDLHGNPVVPINFRFHTETVTPASGALLGTGYSQVLAAAADIEGTLNVLAMVNSNGSVDWIQYNSKTGIPAVVDNYPSYEVGNLVATRTIQADLSSRRLAGLWFNPGSGDNVRYNINGGPHITVAGGQAFIPTPAFPSEGASLAEIGVIVGGVYKRGGRADLAVNLTAIHSVAITDTRWQIVQYVTGGTESQSFGCPTSCSLTAKKTLGGGGSGVPNAASSRSCSIHGYLNGATEMTTLFRWQPGCTSCAADINETGNFDQVTADPAVDGTFYGFNAIGGGQYQLKRRVLAASNCAGAITDVGSPIDLGVVLGQPRIVVIRGVVGLIYADPNHLLKFVGP